MRKLIIILLFTLVLFTCTKSKGPKETYQKVNAYIKEMDVWAISDENELNKKISDIKNKLNLFFGDQVIIVGEKNINQMDYYRITVKNNKNEYWIRKDFIAKDFIIINKKDTVVYEIPDENYSIKAVLQPGDLGIVLKVQGEWLFVNFWAYREKNDPAKKDFIGNMWIKKSKNYIQNIDAAKEAYYLYLAYYYIYTDKNLNVANNYIDKALGISTQKKKKTEITPVIAEIKKEINK